MFGLATFDGKAIEEAPVQAAATHRAMFKSSVSWFGEELLLIAPQKPIQRLYVLFVLTAILKYSST